VIEQHVFGPDVGQRLWVALKAGSDVDGSLPDLYKSQGMKTPRDSPRCFRAAREKRLHITVKGVLTLCSLPVSVVDEVITFEEIIRHFHRSSTAWRRRGCTACGEELRDALTNARRIS